MSPPEAVAVSEERRRFTSLGVGAVVVLILKLNVTRYSQVRCVPVTFRGCVGDCVSHSLSYETWLLDVAEGGYDGCIR